METREFIKKFIDDLVKDAGFGEMPEEMKNVYAEKMEALFMKKVGTELMNSLSNEDIKDFKESIEKKSDLTNEEIFVFFEKRVKNLPEKIGKIMADFRKEYIEAAKKLS